MTEREMNDLRAHIAQHHPDWEDCSRSYDREEHILRYFVPKKRTITIDEVEGYEQWKKLLPTLPDRPGLISPRLWDKSLRNG